MVNSKHAFWQALIVTIAIFIIGLFLGIALEERRAAEAEERFIASELSLMDSFALSSLTKVSGNDSVSCDVLVDSNLNFADRIYQDARSFEEYFQSEMLTGNMKLVLKRYDLLRTLLWINTMDIPKNCMEQTSVVVYLFERDSDDLVIQSTNRVWERVLSDLKQEKGNKIILIPIGIDRDLISLNALTSELGVQNYPTVVIDNEHVISELKSVEEFKEYLK